MGKTGPAAEEARLWRAASALLLPLAGVEETLAAVAGVFFSHFRCDAVLLRWLGEAAAASPPACAAVHPLGAEAAVDPGPPPLRSGYAAEIRCGGAPVLEVAVAYRRRRPPAAPGASHLAVLAERAAVALANALRFEELQRQAGTDSLTGLWNHGALLRFLSHEVAAARVTGAPLCLLFIDLDGFKEINDRWGHPEGDALLQGVGRLIRAATPASGYACRYGGDEFAVLLPGAGEAEALPVAEAVLRGVADLGRRYGHRSRPLTASIGVAALPAAGHSVVGLVRAADRAMYAAKEAGGNRVFLAGAADAAAGA